MTDRFGSKVVVIIGGNSGIGLATAMAFAEGGARLILTGRNPKSLKKAVEKVQHNAISKPLDISCIRNIDSFYADIREEFPCIDVLFVNAGTLLIKPIESVTEKDWDTIQEVNMKGAFFCVQRALPLMRAGSAVVLCSSTAGRLAVPMACAYAASKAGVISIGRSFAAALLDRGIRVNVVSPGPIDTPIFNRISGLSVDEVEAVRRQETECVPMKRLGKPEEVAAAVLFLASEAAAFITGANLVVDGGLLNC